MCNNPSLMKNVKPLKENQYIKVGNGEYVEANAEGTVKLEIKTGAVVRKFRLQNVLLATELKYNLLSVAKCTEAGKTIEFGRNGCKIIDTSTRQTVGSGQKKGNLYYVNVVKKEDKNSRKYAENHKSCNRNLDNDKMKKALNFVNENNFERELRERLERMENKIKVVSNTIKEEKHLNQEDRYYNEEDKNYDVQEDKKQANCDENFQL